jgi:hypothetical protein
MDINLFPKPKTYSDEQVRQAESFLKQNLSTVYVPPDFVEKVAAISVPASPWTESVKADHYTLKYNGIDVGAVNAVLMSVGQYQFLPVTLFGGDENSVQKFLIANRNSVDEAWVSVTNMSWIYKGNTLRPVNCTIDYELSTSENQLQRYLNVLPGVTMTLSVYYKKGRLIWAFRDIQETGTKVDLLVPSYLDNMTTLLTTEYPQRLLYSL